MLRLICEAVVMFVLYAAGSIFLVKRYLHRDRTIAVLTILLAPMIAVVALFRVTIGALFVGLPGVAPCPPDLRDAEAIVEQHRLAMFGASRHHPRIAEKWVRAYEISIEMQAVRVKKLAAQAQAILAAA